MEIRLLETAKEDLRAGYWYYEGQRAGLGDYFLDCLQADVRSLQIYAGIHEKAEGESEGLPRSTSTSFPGCRCA